MTVKEQVAEKMDLMDFVTDDEIRKIEIGYIPEGTVIKLLAEVKVHRELLLKRVALYDDLKQEG